MLKTVASAGAGIAAGVVLALLVLPAVLVYVEYGAMATKSNGWSTLTQPTVG